MRPVCIATMSVSIVASVWSAGSLAVRCHVRPVSLEKKTIASPVLASLVTTQRVSLGSTVARGSVRSAAPCSFTVVKPGSAASAASPIANAATAARATASRVRTRALRMGGLRSGVTSSNARRTDIWRVRVEFAAVLLLLASVATTKTIGLLVTFLGIGVLVNGLIVYIVIQVLGERAENQERLRRQDLGPSRG
jgi:hypothetical protein